MPVRDDRPAIAVWLWGNVIEDWLEPLSLGVHDLMERMDGGWSFGYIRALQSAGVRPVLLVVSAAVERPERHVHGPTGATVWLLPPPRVRRLLGVLRDPYAWSTRGALRTGWIRRLVGLPVWLLSPYLSTPIGRALRVLRAEGCVTLLCQEYEEGRFDLAVVASRLAGVRVFATYQGGNYCRTPLERLVRPRAVRCADGLLIGAEVERGRVQRAYSPSPDRVHNIANPIATPEFPVERSEARAKLGLGQGDIVIAYVGRIEIWTKGLDLLVAAWARCCASRPGSPLRLLLLGSGPDSPQLKQLLEAADAPHVIWRDNFVLDRSLIWTHLAAADVFVHPARHEGFAVGPMEAMAAGLPVVAADAPGIVDLFDGEDLGAVVPRDDAGALADALGAMVDDPDAARARGERARARVLRRFSSAVVGAQLASVLLPTIRGAPMRSFASPGAGAQSSGQPVVGRRGETRVESDRGILPVSVVVPTIGRGSLLKACLHSVLECKPGPAEVVVVDQSGAEEIRHLVLSLGTDRVRTLTDPGRGIARATNSGIVGATQAVVFVTHDDCTVSDDWIKVGTGLLARYPDALLTGKVLPPDRASYVPSTIDDPEPRDWTGTVCSGRLYPANLVVTRDALVAFGGFDERSGLRLAAEDNDLCFRWLASGRALRYEPTLTVWHHDWRSPEDLVRTHITYAHGQGAFYAKHLVARDWRVLPMLAWDLSHGVAAPLRAMRRGTPRWQEPYWEMNVSLLAGIARGLPEALVLNRQARWSRAGGLSPRS